MSDGSGGKVAVVAGGGILALFAGMGRFADDCGRAAIRGGDDVARMGNVGDDVARAGYRSSDEIGRAGMQGDDVARAGVVAGETGVAGERAAENVVRATPREVGFSPAVARKAQRYTGTAPGRRPDSYAKGHRARFVAVPDSAPSSASSFADDLMRAVNYVDIDPLVVMDLLDLLLYVQDLAAGADGEDLDEVETGKIAGEMTREIEAHLATMPPITRRALEQQLGPPEVIAYRLAEGRPLRRAED